MSSNVKVHFNVTLTIPSNSISQLNKFSLLSGRLPPSSESWQAAWLWPHLHSAATREEAAAPGTRDRKEGSAGIAGRGGFLIMGGSVGGEVYS